MKEEKDPDITVIEYVDMEPFRQRVIHLIWGLAGFALGCAMIWILKG